PNANRRSTPLSRRRQIAQIAPSAPSAPSDRTGPTPTSIRRPSESVARSAPDSAVLEQHGADPLVEPVPQADPLGFGERELVEHLACELQQRAIHLVRQIPAGEAMCLIALLLRRRLLISPSGVLMVHYQWRLIHRYAT